MRIDNLNFSRYFPNWKDPKHLNMRGYLLLAFNGILVYHKPIKKVKSIYRIARSFRGRGLWCRLFQIRNSQNRNQFFQALLSIWYMITESRMFSFQNVYEKEHLIADGSIAVALDGITIRPQIGGFVFTYILTLCHFWLCLYTI